MAMLKEINIAYVILSLELILEIKMLAQETQSKQGSQ